MRILLITDSYYPTRDGVVTSITTTKEGLEALGHEVFVVAPAPKEKDKLPGVHYFPAVSFKGYDGYFLPILPSNKIETIKSLDVDVIHIHGIAVMALKGLIAARSLKKPTVLTFHTMVGDTMKYYSPLKMPDELAERLVWIYLRNLLKRPAALITPTSSISAELLGKGVKPKDLRVIPTGIDTRHFVSANGGKIRERHGLIGKKVIIHVGRISFEKNISTVILSLKYLTDVSLLIVGKGPSAAEDSLHELVATNGLQDRVIFAGFVSDDELPEYYGAADVAVSASEFETQGLSILEAMACGLPAACVKARAFTDFIEDGKNGAFFTNGAEDCADAIMRCFAEKEKMGAYARSSAESFSVEASAASLTELYEEVIERNRGR